MITVVEWLIDQLEKKGDASVNMSIGRMQISIIEEDYINLLEQAKEMQEQQQGYSEEEVEDIAKDAYAMGRKGILIGVFNKWFEQFKNK